MFPDYLSVCCDYGDTYLFDKCDLFAELYLDLKWVSQYI